MDGLLYKICKFDGLDPVISICSKFDIVCFNPNHIYWNYL